MPSHSDTSVHQLVINQLPKSVYDNLTPSDTELYFVDDGAAYVTTNMLATVATSGSYNDLTNKPTISNDAVTQTATTTSAAYEVLFSGTADNTTRTEGTRKNSNLTFNPSTGVLTITGNLYLNNPGGISTWTNPEKLVLVGANSNEFSIQVNNNGNNVDIGWDWNSNTGSGLGLRGSGYTKPGEFFLYAKSSSTAYAALEGEADGTLKWNLRRVVTSTEGSQVGSASQPVYVSNTGYVLAGNTIPTITLNGSATTSPSFYAPTAAGTSGQVLTSSGSGAPTWAPAPSGLPSVTTDDNDKVLTVVSGAWAAAESNSSSILVREWVTS